MKWNEICDYMRSASDDSTYNIIQLQHVPKTIFSCKVTWIFSRRSIISWNEGLRSGFLCQHSRSNLHTMSLSVFAMFLCMFLVFDDSACVSAYNLSSIFDMLKVKFYSAHKMVSFTFQNQVTFPRFCDPN